MRILILLFVITPIVEMYVLIRVGQWLGAWPTIGLVVLTAVIGAALLRQQGFATLTRVQQRLNAGELPAQELVEGLLLAIGGALLLTPGFVTDVVGFLCLLPQSRRLLAAAVIRRGVWRVQGGSGGPDGPGGSRVYRTRDGRRVIEGEFTREDDPGP